MTQLNYDRVAPDGFAGLLADSGENRIVSRALEEVAATDFGKPFVAGTDKEVQVLLPSAAGQDFQGVSVHRHNEKTRFTGAAKAQPDENLDILRGGRIFVEVEVTVVAGDVVAFRHTANGPLLPGGWTNVADAETENISAFARWDKGAAAGTVAVLVINLP